MGNEIVAPHDATEDVLLHAHKSAIQENATRVGLQEVANIQIDAHGRQQSVAEALVNCPPFANMVTSLANNLAQLPAETRTNILTNSIKDMAAATAPAVEHPADAAKKKIDLATKESAFQKEHVQSLSTTAQHNTQEKFLAKPQPLEAKSQLSAQLDTQRATPEIDIVRQQELEALAHEEHIVENDPEIMDIAVPVIETKLVAKPFLAGIQPTAESASELITEQPALESEAETAARLPENQDNTNLQAEDSETALITADGTTTLPDVSLTTPLHTDNESFFYEPYDENEISVETFDAAPLILDETEIREVTELNDVIAASLAELPDEERAVAEIVLAAMQEKLAKIFDIFIEQSEETNSTSLFESTPEVIEELEEMCVELLQQLHLEHDEASVKHLLRLLLPANVAIPGLEPEQEFAFTEEGTHEFKLDGAGPGLFTTIATMPGRQAFNWLIGKYILHLHNETVALAVR